MEDTSREYKVSVIFIFLTVVFISAIIITAPLVSNVPADSNNSGYIYAQDGLIYLCGESTPYTGRILDTLEHKIMEYEVVNGLKHGEFLVSNLKGNLTIQGFLEKNKNVGNWKYFYDSGNLESSGNFNNDKPNGKWIWYYPDGNIKSEGYYLSGKPEGKWLNYDEQGLIKAIINYRKGEILSEIEIYKPEYI